MAINVLNSQGTKVYVVDMPASAWTDCPSAISDIKAGKVVGCPQSIGELSEERAVTEYKCLSSDESAKALGSIARGSLELGLLLDPNDAEGQGALRDAFNKNKNIIIAIELPDVDLTGGPNGGSGTIYWFVAGVSSVSMGIEQDAAITYTVTLEISSAITECAMVASSTVVKP